MGVTSESFAPAARFGAALGELASPAMIRLVHWAIRGLSLAQLLAEKPQEVPESVRLLRRMMEALAREG